MILTEADAFIQEIINIEVHIEQEYEQFNYLLYYTLYPDLKVNRLSSYVDLLAHYLREGKYEGRIKNKTEFYSTYPVFDYRAYIANNRDIKNALQKNYSAKLEDISEANKEYFSIIHFFLIGQYQSRVINSSNIFNVYPNPYGYPLHLQYLNPPLIGNSNVMIDFASSFNAIDTNNVYALSNLDVDSDFIQGGNVGSMLYVSNTYPLKIQYSENVREISDQLYIKNANITNLEIRNSSKLVGGLNVADGALNVTKNNLDYTGSANIGGNIFIVGNANIEGILTVDGIIIKNDITNVTTTIFVEDKNYLYEQNLQVTGNVEIGANTKISGNIYVGGNAFINKYSYFYNGLETFGYFNFTPSYDTTTLNTTTGKFTNNSLEISELNSKVTITNLYYRGTNTSFVDTTYWTLECFIYVLSTPGVTGTIINIDTMYLKYSTANKLVLSITSTSTSTTTLSVNTWYHICIVYNSKYTLYINGTKELESTDSTITLTSLTLGGTFAVHSYISELRFSSNERYSSNFTVPIESFDIDTDTILLNNFSGKNNYWGYNYILGVDQSNVKISENLLVNKTIYSDKGLEINGNVFINQIGSMYTNSNVVVNDTLDVYSLSRFKDGFNVNSGNLTVDKYGNLKTLGQIDVNNNVYIAEHFNLNNTFFIDPLGNTNIHGNLNIGNLIINSIGSLFSNSNIYTNTSLDAILGANIGLLSIDECGNLTTQGNIYITDSLDVQEVANLYSGVDINDGNVIVNLDGDLIAKQNFIIGNLTIDSDGQLNTTSNIVIDNTLDVNDLASFQMGIDINDSTFTINADGNLYTEGQVTIMNTINVIDSNVDITGITTIQNTASNITSYPESALISNTYNNYTASASSTLSTTNVYAAFNKVYGSTSTTYWSCNSGLYSSTTGIYIGTTYTTYNENLQYDGEWIQLELPEPIRLTSYEIYPLYSQYNYHSPSDYILVGSTDNINWYLIDEQNDITWTTTQQTFTVVSSNYFQYYRLIASTVGNNIQTSSRNAFSLSELVFYGKEQIETLNVVGDTSISQSLFVGDDRLVVIEDGYVGIATNNPQSQLHIEGNAYITDSLGINTVDPSYTLDIIGDANISDNLFVQEDRLVVNTYGNVGIGTLTPTADLQVIGITKLFGNNNIGITIDTRGNIGIGTNTPTANLHVIGTTQMTGIIQVSGNLTCSNLIITSNTDQSELLRFNTDRPWVFKQEGIGSSTGLTLQAVTTGKRFNIATSSTSGDYSFSCYESITENRVINMSGNVRLSNSLSVSGNINNTLILDTNTSNIFLGNLRINSGNLYVEQDTNINGNCNIKGNINNVLQLDTNTANFYTSNVRINSGNLCVIGTAQLTNNNNVGLYINSLGNIGIGTTNPIANLHVQGTANITGSLTTTSTIYAPNISFVRYDGAVWPYGITSTTNSLYIYNASGSYGGTKFYLNSDGIELYSGNIGANIYGNTTIGSVSTNKHLFIFGNVGIGTGTANISYSRLNFSNITESKISLFDYNSTSYYGFGVGASSLNYHVGNSTSYNHIFYRGGRNGNGTELMRIQGTGNIGIGTNTPLANLHVCGTTQLTNNSGVGLYINSYGNVGIGTTQSLANLHVIGTSQLYGTNNNGLIINNNGNIGIGTTNPTSNLHVIGKSQLLGTNLLGLIVDTLGNVGINKTNPSYDLEVGGNINFSGNLFQNGTVFLSGGGSSSWTRNINNLYYADGNVGLGTTNPLYNLDVGGNVNFTGNLYQKGILFSTSQWTTNSTIIYYNTGNVGIGTTNPLYKLDVNGNVNFNGNLYQNGTLFSTSQWITNSKSIYYTTGNVGIGTTVPRANLDVQGDFYLTGNIYSNGNIFGMTGSYALYEANSDVLIGLNNTCYISWKLGTTGYQSGVLLSNDGTIITLNNHGIYQIVSYILLDNTVLTTTGNLVTTVEYYQNSMWNTFKSIESIQPYSTDYNASLNANFHITTIGYSKVWRIRGYTSYTSNIAIKTNSWVTITSLGAPGVPFWQSGQVYTNEIYYKSGNVGIGTTAPTKTLDISGDLNLTGNVYQNGVMFNLTGAYCLYEANSSVIVGNSTTNSISWKLGTSGYQSCIELSNDGTQLTLSNQGVYQLNHSLLLDPSTVSTSANLTTILEYYQNSQWKIFKQQDTNPIEYTYYNVPITNSFSFITLGYSKIWRLRVFTSYIGNISVKTDSWLTLSAVGSSGVPFWLSGNVYTNEVYYNSGNVGIGTTVPCKTLDIGGDINLSGNVYQNGVLFAFTGSYAVYECNSTLLYGSNCHSYASWTVGTTGYQSGISLSSDGTQITFDNQGIYLLNTYLSLDSTTFNTSGNLLTILEYYADSQWNTFKAQESLAPIYKNTNYYIPLNSSFTISTSGYSYYWRVRLFSSYSGNISIVSTTNNSLMISSLTSQGVPFWRSGNINSNEVYYNTGNVGIGSSVPCKTLDVVGDINFTGNIYKDGDIYGLAGCYALYESNSSVLIGASNCYASWTLGTSGYQSGIGLSGNGIVITLSNHGIYQINSYLNLQSNSFINSGNLYTALEYHSNSKWNTFKINECMAPVNNFFNTPLIGSFTVATTDYSLNWRTRIYTSYNGNVTILSNSWLTLSTLGSYSVPFWKSGNIVNNEIYYNSGNIGIGTSSPIRTLDINGDINISGNANITTLNLSDDITLKSNGSLPTIGKLGYIVTASFSTSYSLTNNTAYTAGSITIDQGVWLLTAKATLTPTTTTVTQQIGMQISTQNSYATTNDNSVFIILPGAGQTVTYTNPYTPVYTNIVNNFTGNNITYYMIINAYFTTSTLIFNAGNLSYFKAVRIA